MSTQDQGSERVGAGNSFVEIYSGQRQVIDTHLMPQPIVHLLSHPAQLGILGERSPVLQQALGGAVLTLINRRDQQSPTHYQLETFPADQRVGDVPQWVRNNEFVAPGDGNLYRLYPDLIPQPIRDAVTHPGDLGLVGSRSGVLSQAIGEVMLLLINQRELQHRTNYQFETHSASSRRNKSAPEWVRNGEFIQLGEVLYRVDLSVIPVDIRYAFTNPGNLGITGNAGYTLEQAIARATTLLFIQQETNK